MYMRLQYMYVTIIYMYILWDWNNLQLYTYFTKKQYQWRAWGYHKHYWIFTPPYKKNPCMMQCCLNHIHKYTLGDYKDAYTWTSSEFLSKSYVIIFLKNCYLYMYYYTKMYILCNNSPKIIYPLFKDQLFGERNSPGINSWRFITGLCVWHVWYAYVSLQI
jgi:hypothetical protein